MNTERRTELMHAVLDGEATDEQARQLWLLLDTDPAAKGEFERLQSLFDDLAAVPQRRPPEGLVHAVMTAVSAGAAGAQPASDAQRVQLSGGWRVFGSILRARGSKSSATFRPASGTESTRRGAEMNKLWIGGGIAAVAVVLVAQFGLSGGTADKDVSGTIVPADRYRAAQPTAVPTATPSGITSPGTVAVPTQVQGNTAQSNAAQADTAQAGSAQAGSAQAGSAQAGAAQADTAQAAAAQAKSAQAGTAQAGAAQANSAQAAAAQAANAQAAAAQAATAQAAAAQAKSAQAGAAQAGNAQANSAQAAAAQAANAQAAAAQAGNAQANSAQAAAAQAAAAQAAAAQAAAAQAKTNQAAAQR